METFKTIIGLTLIKDNFPWRPKTIQKRISFWKQCEGGPRCQLQPIPMEPKRGKILHRKEMCILKVCFPKLGKLCDICNCISKSRWSTWDKDFQKEKWVLHLFPSASWPLCRTYWESMHFIAPHRSPQQEADTVFENGFLPGVLATVLIVVVKITLWFEGTVHHGSEVMMELVATGR